MAIPSFCPLLADIVLTAQITMRAVVTATIGRVRSTSTIRTMHSTCISILTGLIGFPMVDASGIVSVPFVHKIQHRWENSTAAPAMQCRRGGDFCHSFRRTVLFFLQSQFLGNLLGNCVFVDEDIHSLVGNEGFGGVPYAFVFVVGAP